MVGRRTREFGVRMALGARPGQVLRLVMGQAVRQVAAGIVLGTAGAFGAARLLQSQLFGISGFDHWTGITVVAVLCAVAAIAVWSPARRATGSDPLVALRAECKSRLTWQQAAGTEQTTAARAMHIIRPASLNYEDFFS